MHRLPNSNSTLSEVKVGDSRWFMYPFPFEHFGEKIVYHPAHMLTVTGFDGGMICHNRGGIGNIHCWNEGFSTKLEAMLNAFLQVNAATAPCYVGRKKYLRLILRDIRKEVGL